MGDASPSLASGTKLDRYELLCPIASGGMASVWLARLHGKRGFEKLVAIKTIKTELITDPQFQQMFLDEARLASAIQHPNVAQIIDLGEHEDTLYTVMEWVDGESLAKIYRLALKRGTPLPLGISLRVMAEVCGGLHAAHELRDSNDVFLGVVHRDVSPENVLVTSAGAVKVIDFGIAKVKNRRSGETRSGVVKGKIRYMAPEQVNGLAIDRRADLWAVGMCLYELVTGTDPFGDDGDIDVMRRLMSADPTPRMHGLTESLLPVLPIFARSLAADPNARFEDAAAMRRALLAAMEELGVASTSEEDVAAFVRDNLPDLEKKRRARLAQGMENAEAQSERQLVVAPIPDGDDVALAATEVSRGPAPEVPPETTRKPTPAARLSADEDLGASPTSSADHAPPRSFGERMRAIARGPAAWLVAGLAIIALVVSLFRSRATENPTPPAVASAPTPSAPTPSVTTSATPPSAFEIIEVPVATPPAAMQPRRIASASAGIAAEAGAPAASASATEDAGTAATPLDPPAPAPTPEIETSP